MVSSRNLESQPASGLSRDTDRIARAIARHAPAAAERYIDKLPLRLTIERGAYRPGVIRAGSGGIHDVVA